MWTDRVHGTESTAEVGGDLVLLGRVWLGVTWFSWGYVWLGVTWPSWVVCVAGGDLAILGRVWLGVPGVVVCD